MCTKLFRIIIISGLLISFSMQANAAKGLHAEHLQSGMENKRSKQPKADFQPLLPRKAHHRVDWNKILKLSKQQQAQIDAIYGSSESEISELRNQIHEAHRKIGDIYREDDKKIREILDEQQKIKFDKYQYHHKKRAGEKPDGEKPSRKKMSVF